MAGAEGVGSLYRLGLDGVLDTVVELPVSRVTSCCFAGDTLLITTARPDAAGEPLAGAVFACAPGVSAPPATVCLSAPPA